LKRIELKGLVFSGEGTGKRFVDLPWVNQQISEKLDFIPYSGTLNLRLNEKSIKCKKLLEKTPTEKIIPVKGYFNGALFKAFIGILECAIVIPQISDYPEDLLEVIASVNLRKALELEDGCEVIVTVNL
jgi:riboflavin kinase